MVYLPGLSLEGAGFHSGKGQFFACQFLSIVAQIFAFLVLLMVKVINSAQQCCACCLLHVSSICHRSVGTHMCR